jgi:thioredoxin reductase (NADPH)
VLIATGARYRKLPIRELERFEGTSVFYAATPVEARVCAGDPVAVAGGGNSAGQAALFLSQHASLVRLIVREPSLEQHMSRYLIDRIERSDRIEVRLESEIRAAVGEDALAGLVVEENRGGGREELSARALFVFIGVAPHTGWLGDEVALDERGFVLTGRDAGAPLHLESSRPGVLAAGDVRSGSIKRVASAVGEGAMAVSSIHQHLAAQRGPRPAAQTNASST